MTKVIGKKQVDFPKKLNNQTASVFIDGKVSLGGDVGGGVGGGI